MQGPMRAVALLWVCAIGMACSAHAAGGPVLINELMAVNSDSHADPQGEYDDWVELYNAGDTQADLTGMCLTDDDKVPAQWRIPYGTKIAAKGYLLIWLDGDIADSGLHASFRLDAAGDRLLLYDVDGATLLDYVHFGKQRSNISYGRSITEVDVWRFMMMPTPGALNTLGYDGAVADTKFDCDRGFYDDPFDVTIACDTPGATIYYTLDGSEPGSPSGRLPKGRLYTGPIRIATTTCLRAQAVKDGWLPTNVDTHSYIFLDDVITQGTNPQTGAPVTPPGCPASWGSIPGDYQMDPDVVGQNGKDKFGGLYAKTIKDDLKSAPTVSLVMPLDDWFGSKGIYINQSQDGTERVCSLEWIDPNGEGGFQINCAIAMQGGAKHDGGGTSLERWKVLKLSMRPRFKTATDDGTPTGGPATLNYRVFPDSPVATFDTFVLDEVMTNAWNHSGQHMYGTYIQDQYVSDLHNAMGGHSPHGLYAHVYLNGLYWGMYYVHERPDDSWAAQMFGGEKEEYDVLKHSTSRVVNNGQGGSAAGNFNAMLSAANRVRSEPENMAAYEALCGMLDIDNFITDLLAHWYATNWDWPEKNWYATHRSPDGLWRFHTWDAEHSMEYWNTGQTTLGRSVYDIHDRLKGNAEYRMHFADLVHRFFFNDGPLTYPRTAEMYQARMAQIDRAIVGESARWGDTRSSTPHTREDWLANQNNVLSRFIAPRSDFVLNWLRNAGLYPAVDAPVFHVNGQYQHGGQIDIGDSVTMQGGGTIWYTLDGSDPRIPSSGGSTGDDSAVLVAENAAKRVLVPTGPVSSAWRGGQEFADSAWINGSGGVGYERSTGYESLFSIDLLESMYAQQTTCCVRIPFTLSQDPATFSGVQLKVRYDDGFVAWINGVEVARRNFTGEPLWNSASETTNSDVDAVELETIVLPNAQSCLRVGQNVLAIQGLNEGATSSDFLLSVMLVGSGATPAVPADVSTNAIKYTGPVSLARSVCVKARALSGSTWSALNEAVYSVGPVAENLRISEIQYHPAGDPNAEFIELTNVGPEAINLNFVRFAKGIQYIFPSYELAPHDYCLLVKDIAAFGREYVGWVLDPRVEPDEASPDAWVENPPYGLPIVGLYAGSLDNAGERIELLDAAGETVESFEYQDDWYDSTDGEGFSLTRRAPASSADASDESAWRPSAAVGGSPGADDGE